jgi:concanavalin A-like lectin/glucanase superfamily protein
MQRHNRSTTIFVLLLLALPLPLAGVPMAVMTVAATFPGEVTNATFDIANPAFLYASLRWDDGALRNEQLTFEDVTVSISGDTHPARTMWGNPAPVEPAQTVRISVYPRNNPLYLLWDQNYTSGAAGSFHVVYITLNMQVWINSSFFPTRILFRPYDAATGAGLPIEQFNLTVQFPEQFVGITKVYEATNETPIGGGYLNTFYNLPIILRVRDYFGNLLYNATRTFRINESNFCANTGPSAYKPACGIFSDAFETWDIPLGVFSVKFYNQKPDQFTKFDLHWNGTGAGEEIFAPNGGLIPPWWDSHYVYRHGIKINTSQVVPPGYIYNLTLPGADYVAAGKIQADYRDLRVVYWNGSSWKEASRAFNGTNLTWEQQEPVSRAEVSPAAGAWKFDEATGTAAADASGNGNTGTLTNGPAWTYGVSGSGIVFDGSNDYVVTPDSSTTSVTGAFTLAAWIKTTSATTQQGIIEKYKDGGCGACGGYLLRLTSSGKLFGATVDATGAATTITGATTITAGIWHHVQYVFTGTNHFLYLDGIQDATAANTRNPADDAQTLKIGARGDDASFPFSGAIDEPRIYSFARSAAQTACDYAPKSCTAVPASTTTRSYWIYYGNPLASTAPPLLNASYRAEVLASNPAAYWPLDDNTGTSAADASGNGNTGTLTSGPTWTAGLHKYGVSFDGSNDYIDVPNSASLNIVGSQITLEAWILCPCAGSNRQIYSKDVGVPVTDRRYASYIDAGSLAGFETRTSAGTVDTTKGSAFLQNGIWRNVIMTYDGATMSWYIDGLLQGTQAQTGNIVDSSAVSLNIGRFHTGVSFFNGVLDELSIYPRFFSQAEVWAHHNTSISHPTLTQPPWAALESSQGFAWFNSPGETVERFLNPGYYEVTITTDNRTGVQSKATLGFNITEANYFMVSGTNITRFIGDFTSIYSQTVQIQNAFRPDVVHIGELLPSSPTDITPPSVDPNFILIHPFSILTGTTAYAAASSANATAFMPNFSSSSGDGSLLSTITVTKDTFVFSGSTTAHVWINYTNGTNIWENATLPPSVTLPGTSGDVYVVSNQSIQVTRISDFRAIWEFSFRYYPSTKRYEQSLTLNNSMNRTVINPQWFVGFPENRSINITSAAVKDLDNNVWLTKGQHYDVTASGFYLDFQQLNASIQRSFFFVFYDLNGTDGQSVPILQISEIQRTTYQGSNAWWLGATSFTNAFTSPYAGDIVIKFTCPECAKIRAETIEIYDDTKGRKLDASEFFAGAGSVTISRSAIGEVPVGGAENFRVYFRLQLDPADEDFSLFAPLITIAGLGISVLLILFGAAMVSGAMTVLTSDKERKHLWFTAFVFLGLISLLVYIGRPGGLNVFP